ncbi:MAG: hypothetical protein ACP5NS_00305 [Candidatus Pacearchaeota archaeon]
MKFVLFTFIILMVAVAGLFIYLDSDEPDIKDIYTNSTGQIVKIVYQTSDDFGVDYYKNHCSGLGGYFEECGDICSPNSSYCVEVCAMTCSFP